MQMSAAATISAITAVLPKPPPCVVRDACREGTVDVVAVFACPVGTAPVAVGIVSTYCETPEPGAGCPPPAVAAAAVTSAIVSTTTAERVGRRRVDARFTQLR
jgi:hypothetical protein